MSKSFEMDAALQLLLFEASAESPGSWWLIAHELKTAADRLDPMEKPIADDEDAPHLLRPYRLVVALSIENLLKGIMVATGMPLLQNGKFNRAFNGHDLVQLTTKIHSAGLSFSGDEIATLQNLSSFILWSGRYPTPKKAEECDGVMLSTKSRLAETALFSKLSDHLYNIAWVMKGGSCESGGTRLYLDKSPTPTERDPVS